jgi:hypothetical protein
LKGPNWRRVGRGFYTPTIDGALTPGQRILDAAPFIGGGVLGGWAAAYVHGVDWLDGIDPFTFEELRVDCLAVRRPQLPAIRHRNNVVPRADRMVVDGIAVTTPTRTAFDGARWAGSLEEAVVFTDAVAHFTGIDPVELERFAVEHPYYQGVQQAIAAAKLTNGDVLSSWESRLRCCYLLDAGLPDNLLVNVPIFAGGRELGRPDLLDPDAGLVLEFDGAQHRDRAQHHRDNIREEEFEDTNLTVLRADSLDLTRERDSFVRRVHTGYARSVVRDRSKDRWTLDPPPGWRPHGPRIR